ncbi:hypothetical protein ES703_117019 [subsurface metagenome]
MIFFRVALISASDRPVGGPEGGASPFCCSVSSPRNQSGGGFSQNSLVPDSYFFSPFCCATASPAIATAKVAASASTHPWIADFIASLPYAGRSRRYCFEVERRQSVCLSRPKSLSHPKRVRSARLAPTRAAMMKIELGRPDAVRFQARQFALRQICGDCIAAQ